MKSPSLFVVRNCAATWTHGNYQSGKIKMVFPSLLELQTTSFLLMFGETTIFQCKDLESSNWKQPFPIGCFRFQLAILSSDEFGISPDILFQNFGVNLKRRNTQILFFCFRKRVCRNCGNFLEYLLMVQKSDISHQMRLVMKTSPTICVGLKVHVR